MIDFTYQLSTLYSAGIPLATALHMIAQGHPNMSLQALLKSVSNDVESGSLLSGAFKKHRRHFDSLFCSLIAVGEESGTLEKMLCHLVNYQEKSLHLKNQIKAACLYPAVVFSIAIMITGTMLIFVVPQFERLFQGFGAQLPLYTQGIVSLAHALRRYGWLAAPLFLGVIALTIHLRRHSNAFAIRSDNLLLRCPIIGTLLRKSMIIRLSRTLSITTHAGLPLVNALEGAAKTVTYHTYKTGILQIVDAIARGQSLHRSMHASHLFPNRVLQMIASGEESGRLSEMLEKVANLYDAEVEKAVSSLSRLLEPAIMVILGLLIGGLIIGMYLPIFRMASVF